jgi:hypothetical protein
VSARGDGAAAAAPTGIATLTSRLGSPHSQRKVRTTCSVTAATLRSGHGERATPAASVVTVPPSELSPFPEAFQSARLNAVLAGRPPTLHAGVSSVAAFRPRPCVSSPSNVS